MATASPIPEIGLVLYPRAQLAAVHGLTDLFGVAERLARERLGGCEPLLRVSHLSGGAGNRRVARTFDTRPGAGGEPVVLILPPSLGGPPARKDLPGLIAFLKARHAAGATLASVCAGAFVLAETGLLSGRKATTHWAFASELAARFPDVWVDAEKLVVDDGDIITAGGLMAWTDLGLKLVGRLLGPAAMIETARFLIVDPPGREQRPYSAFSPRLTHGDDAILKVQRWLQASGARDVTLAAMAARAGLEQRTFLRRFRNATGLRPTEYCQQLRVGRAREMLEATTRPIDQIAYDVGYADAGSFRKLFVRVTGLAPGDYRRRFGADRAPARSPRQLST
jgi:transcriptional regulator GlxA family with amidase domain